MFTGIIQEIGQITKVNKSEKKVTFTIETKSILNDKKIGESIAVNGACVTITDIKKKRFKFDAMAETLEISNFKYLKEKDKVNLEPTLRLHQSLDGHLVQGHVDAEGITESLETGKDRSILTIKFPKSVARYLAFKGSITINGVSLTISKLETETFSVDLIPHTLEKTNLKNLKKGDKVNLEIDLIARYLSRLLDNKEKEAKYEFLIERNLI